MSLAVKSGVVVCVMKLQRMGCLLGCKDSGFEQRNV